MQGSYFDDYEHIIIDDGYTDNTEALLREYSNHFKFIKYITYQENNGVNFARNRGVEIATGSYVIFLDSDDTLNNGILKTISDCIDSNQAHSHFLLDVSSNKTKYHSKREIKYKQFLLEKVHGDFLHIVKTNY